VRAGTEHGARAARRASPDWPRCAREVPHPGCQCLPQGRPVPEDPVPEDPAGGTITGP